MPHKQKIPVEEKIKIVQDCLSNRISTSDAVVVCGHWHASYGHSKYEGKCSEFGADADFSPYYGPRIIAIDACTSHSKKVNVIVIED